MSATMFNPSLCDRPASRSGAGILRVWFRRMRERARDRATLRLLSDRELSDMRTNRYEVLNELAKPFWRG